MSSGQRERGKWRPWAPWIALLLWIATILLGLQTIYSALQLFYVIFGVFGYLELATQFATLLLCAMGVLMIGLLIGSGEYHRTRIDQANSWRLFAWTLGFELTIVLLHFFLTL